MRPEIKKDNSDDFYCTHFLLSFKNNRNSLCKHLYIPQPNAGLKPRQLQLSKASRTLQPLVPQSVQSRPSGPSLPAVNLKDQKQASVNLAQHLPVVIHRHTIFLISPNRQYSHLPQRKS
jgi:hypothetical protein